MADTHGQLLYIQLSPMTSIALMTADNCSDPKYPGSAGAVAFWADSGAALIDTNFSRCYTTDDGSAIYAEEPGSDTKGQEVLSIMYTVFCSNSGPTSFRSDRPQNNGIQINRFERCVFLNNQNERAVCYSLYSLLLFNTLYIVKFLQCEP
jgi:hypothetical protein